MALCFHGLLFGKCLAEECFVCFVIVEEVKQSTSEKELWGSSFTGNDNFGFIFLLNSSYL